VICVCVLRYTYRVLRRTRRRKRKNVMRGVDHSSRTISLVSTKNSTISSSKS